MVPAFSPPWSGLSELFTIKIFFPSYQNPRSSAAGLAILRPREEVVVPAPLFTGPRFLGLAIFFFPQVFCSCPSPSLAAGRRVLGREEAGRPAFWHVHLALSVPFMVMRSTSCSFEGRFSPLWGHFWDISPSLTFRSSVWSVNDSPYLLSFF